MVRALSFFATEAASFGETMTVMPMPMLKDLNHLGVVYIPAAL